MEEEQPNKSNTKATPADSVEAPPSRPQAAPSRNRRPSNRGFATMLENPEALPTSELHGWSAVRGSTTLTSKRSSLQFYATTVKEDVRPTSLQRRTSELSSLLAPLEDPEETDDLPEELPPLRGSSNLSDLSTFSTTKSSKSSSIDSTASTDSFDSTPASLPSATPTSKSTGESTGETKETKTKEKDASPFFNTRRGRGSSAEDADPSKKKIKKISKAKKKHMRRTMEISSDGGGVHVVPPKSPPSAPEAASLKVLTRKKSAPPPVSMKMIQRTRSMTAAKKLAKEEQQRASFDAANPLTKENIIERTTSGKGILCDTLEYSWRSQRGYYPNEPKKRNQDACLVLPSKDTNGRAGYFGVYDGHGKYGDKVSEYVRDSLPKLIQRSMNEGTYVDSSNFDEAYSNMYVDCNERLHRTRKIDDSCSGTTAASAWIENKTVKVANIGDSRVIVGRKRTKRTKATKGSTHEAIPLSSDQTPYRKDERERIKKTGARVITYDMLEGKIPIHENWDSIELGVDVDEGGDPPRVWHPTGKYPGNAFTRSIGDNLSEPLGVYAIPELTTHVLLDLDEYIVVASDGIWEFMTNQQCLDIITAAKNLDDACEAIVSEAYRLWITNEVRTDDITAIIIKRKM